MVTIFHCCKSTVQYFFVCFQFHSSSKTAPRPVLSDRELVLFLHNLDDVLVLHDVCEADPLRAVLGTGSLENQKKNTVSDVLAQPQLDA